MTAKVLEEIESNNEDSEESDEGNFENDDSNSDDNLDENIGTSNASWADSISKILKTNKPKGKKTLVLSKAKKLNEIKREKSKPAGFQVATADGEIQDAKLEIKDEEVEKVDGPPRKKKRELPNPRVKPNILEKDRERTLTKIATKGVVHLFNAVRTQQKDISNKLKEAGPLEVRKERVMKNIDKRAFLDVLMGEKSQDVDQIVSGKDKTKKETERNQNSTWSVLRDDFMMSAKMKDWDKQLDEEEEEETEVVLESD